jgi:hypothetical protein
VWKGGRERAIPAEQVEQFLAGAEVIAAAVKGSAIPSVRRD